MRSLNTIPALLIFIILMTNVAFAKNYETDVTNNLNIGDVSIELSEYTLDEHGKEVQWIDNQVVLPGQPVDKIIKIRNNAEPCWIRTKIEYSSKDGINGLSEDMIDLDSDNWKKYGDYYYYMAPLEKKESIIFINKVTIPYEWDQNYAEKKFSIIVSAEAVQESNFTPDFTSEEPWFGTLIETCVHTSYDDTNIEKKNFYISFENGAEGLIKIGDDFFGNFNSLMPGDSVSDSVSISNKYSSPVSMYFRTESLQEDELLELIQIQIKSGDNILYDGPLKSETLSDNYLIGKLMNGEETKIDYTLTVPETLTNQYAMKSTSVKWIFSADLHAQSKGYNTDVSEKKEIDSPTEITYINIGETETDTGIPNNMNPLPEQGSGTKIAAMGDTYNSILYFIVIFLSLAGITFIINRKIKRKR